jgi:hypothetical protein
MLITNKMKTFLLAFTGMMITSWMELVRVIKWQIAWRRGETEGLVKKWVICVALPSSACPYTSPCVVL